MKHRNTAAGRLAHIMTAREFILLHLIHAITLRKILMYLNIMV